MITINLDPALDQMRGKLDRLADPVQRVCQRALRKLMRWLRRQLLQQLARETGLKQKTLQQYRRVHIQLGKMDSQLWLGLNPLPLHEPGRVCWVPASSEARKLPICPKRSATR